MGKAFDNVVEDWKIKMEVIIGEGLKKLRKAPKEKKMMMKYLPGDRRINAAKKDIAKDWKIDFQKGFGTTHKKLEKLAADKAKEVENVVKTDVKEPQMFQNKYKKQVVNINLRSNQESAYGNLKELISQLDKMINYVQSDISPTVHSIPIYSNEARGQVLPAYNNQWLNLQKSMLNVGNRQSFLDVLEDFKIKYNQDKVIKKITKSRVEGTNVVMAQRRMLERKVAKKALSTESTKHVLREFQKDGKDHYLIVKKKTVTNPDMEEILSDWNQNLDASHQQRKQAAIVARKTRTRKLSNRALRKSLVKEIEENEKKKPVSYSDALKKNLKAPMEDIFEAWRDYLQELDDIVKTTPEHLSARMSLWSPFWKMQKITNKNCKIVVNPLYLSLQLHFTQNARRRALKKKLFLLPGEAILLCLMTTPRPATQIFIFSKMILTKLKITLLLGKEI